MTYSRMIAALLLGLLCSSCVPDGKRAYRKALRQGTLLLPNDTVQARVGEQLLYNYEFSAGVQPIYYTLAIINSDTQALSYQSNPEFYIGDPDMTGGPAAGLHIFQAKAPGLVRLEFYNPYFNQNYYQTEATTTSYDLWVAVANYLGTPDTAFFNAQEWQYWQDAYNAATDSSEFNHLWQTLYEELGTPRPVLTVDSTDMLFERILPLTIAGDPNWNATWVDSLLGHYDGPEDPWAARWRQRWYAYSAAPPLHPKLPTKVCYVRIR